MKSELLVTGLTTVTFPEMSKMNLLTRNSTRLSQQHRAQEILQQENLFDDSSGSKLLKPPSMSSSGKASNAKFLAAFQQKSDQAEKMDKELALAQQRERCRSIPLDQLGAEKVTAGKAKDQTVKAACEDAKYLKWLLPHQADNINFVNLLICSERSLLTTTEQNSGDEPTGKDKKTAPSEMNDWEQVIGSPSQIGNDLMFAVIKETLAQLKHRVSQLEEISNQQAQMTYHGLSQQNSHEEKFENLNQRLSELEQAAARK